MLPIFWPTWFLLYPSFFPSWWLYNIHAFTVSLSVDSCRSKNPYMSDYKIWNRSTDENHIRCLRRGVVVSTMEWHKATKARYIVFDSHLKISWLCQIHAVCIKNTPQKLVEIWFKCCKINFIVEPKHGERIIESCRNLSWCCHVRSFYIQEINRVLEWSYLMLP